MKIGQTPEHSSAVAQSNASKQAKAAAPAAQESTKAAASSATAGAGVAVTLSRGAREIEQGGRTSADFNAGRVKAVRSAIENGTFKVDAGAIADKMLANAEELFAHSRG